MLFCEKCLWNFVRDYIESVECFGLSEQCDNILQSTSMKYPSIYWSLLQFLYQHPTV